MFIYYDFRGQECARYKKKPNREFSIFETHYIDDETNKKVENKKFDATKSEEFYYEGIKAISRNKYFENHKEITEAEKKDSLFTETEKIEILKYRDELRAYPDKEKKAGYPKKPLPKKSGILR